MKCLRFPSVWRRSPLFDRLKPAATFEFDLRYSYRSYSRLAKMKGPVPLGSLLRIGSLM